MESRDLRRDRRFPCKDTRACFARDAKENCTLLIVGYPEGECPFCKAERNSKEGIEHERFMGLHYRIQESA